MGKRYNIAMFTDSFYPKMGGIEVHIFSLAQCLLKLKHKVIVITRQLEKCYGVRYMEGGLKVYYIPTLTVFPDFFSSFPLIRYILIQEKINIIHAHSEMYHIGMEAVAYGNLMKIHTIITLHSLFGLSTEKTILFNYFFSAIHRSYCHYICVSNSTKINFLMRYQKVEINDEPGKYTNISVIPNAICTNLFKPLKCVFDKTDYSTKMSKPLIYKKMITIVIVTRLEYRKGIMLIPGILKRLFHKYSNVNVIIGGSGSKRIYLEEFREKFDLHDKINILGGIRNEFVRDVLVKGDIFLNTSLTESFCIAILEAAACGLYVVSTNVGGIPEVAQNLNKDMIKLTEPSVCSLTESLFEAIDFIRTTPTNILSKLKKEQYLSIKSIYNWNWVAEETCKIYQKISLRKHRDKRYILRGVYQHVHHPINLLFIVYSFVMWLWFIVLQFLFPMDKIESCDIDDSNYEI
ncbi:GlcNAc-PI synthesis protein [Intoshia linei]|uniref:GlcNAc-PI synthesis protein n=1 Tax=Intoshia linei TaxID=1819745 RepID=A0A177AWW9_9BILA|nr:GlcNAc-PI synthesis protein [Intoshia linei]